MCLKNSFVLLLILLLVNACNNKVQDASPAMFTLLPAEESGIRFNNTITEAADDSTLLLEFAYMGGGVGIGDFNNDGLKDIYFTGNQVSSRLYINKGKNKFEDITEKAGVATAVWATGVSIVDINADGFDDIYVCTFGKDHAHRAKNLFFINQQNLTFKEEAAAYNLADTSYSTQAAFFDYDKDGDLDMYLLNYMLNGPNANTIYPRNLTGSSPANDKLYRNDGEHHFTDVTKEAGIKDDGYGLGIVVSDFNNDNWPDIYVSDDFLSNDFLWINNRNGSFTNKVSTALRHQGYSSMGVDAADFNNDGLADITTVDMLPENNERKKISYSFMNYERYQMERSMNYEPEFMRNMLQLNNGLRQDSTPFFSEIGQLAGMSETDWSWSVLMADFNNDGYKDMHITNGIGRDFINADFVQFTSTVAGMQDEAARKKIIKEKLASLEYVRLKNYFLLNNKDLRFKQASDSAGFRESSMSNGAAWADLDNDGDLDLVVNNINEEAFVYVNNTNKKQHYLQLVFEDSGQNPHAIGAKVYIWTGGKIQYQELNPVRGYLSTMDLKLTFGLGDKTTIEKMMVVWPDNDTMMYPAVKTDTLLVIERPMATGAITAIDTVKDLFTDISRIVPYLHKETEYNDFGVQRLLPQKYSQLGPFITTGDINGDGLEDFFVGGGFNSSGKFFIRQKKGGFISRNLTDSIKMQEDMDCILFDADGDKDLDLVITSGDVRYEDNSPYNAPRLYQNDGHGNFAMQPIAFPATVKTIAGCITAGDYDGDGDSDLFIGGRVNRQYPLPPKSFILQNDKGIFKDVTATVCPALQQGGMICSAIWTDFDNDHQPDLVVAGEWMPVRFFKNNKGKLKEFSTGLTAIKGMWRSLAAADMDKDGDMDIVAGNLGLNCSYRVSEKYPMKLFAKDIDNNGSIDPVMFYYIKTNSGERKLFPSIGKDMLTSQVPGLKKKFVHHKEYIPTTVDDIFTDKTGLLELTCDETASCYFENLGNGQFTKHVLPVEAQFAPVNTILCNDFDNDGHTDLLIAGNEYQTEVMTGRYDASYGLLLKGAGKNNFVPQPPSATGFITNGDVKNMKLLTSAGQGSLVLLGVNADSLQAFRVNKK